jgi:hypothetical protein
MGMTRVPPVDSSSPTTSKSDVTERVSVEDYQVLELLSEVLEQLKMANLHNELITGERLVTDDLRED